MGGRLCTHVLNLPAMGYGKNLTDRDRLVLLAMASVARDQATTKLEAGVYYAGWEYLARNALGFPDYTGTAERAVARSIAHLVTEGLIEPLREAKWGQNQLYLLTLPGLGKL